MKWFKHMANSRKNEHIQAIIEYWGMAGVTRYFWILEIIAENMDYTDRCGVTYRPGYWTRELGFRSAKDCRSFLDWLANGQGMIGVRFVGDWYVECPKLLKIRARISPTARKKPPLEEEVEEEVEKKPLQSPLDQEFKEEFWPKYPNKVAKRAASSAYLRARKRAPKEKILLGLERDVSSEQWSRDGGKFIPHPTTWLNQDRWSRELLAPEPKSTRPQPPKVLVDDEFAKRWEENRKKKLDISSQS